MIKKFEVIQDFDCNGDVIETQRLGKLDKHKKKEQETYL